eukprot:TRINITY_DN6440_c0_g1_i7.p1 TRINITY_DN6440_c0_g1~~TRINITY_DN6440_c0_g1_i7.p1  ORF type:complete len:221 (+),score=42.38 TRINITY_DN6440_c0_g1_i7:60-665(+)
MANMLPVMRPSRATRDDTITLMARVFSPVPARPVPVTVTLGMTGAEAKALVAEKLSKEGQQADAHRMRLLCVASEMQDHVELFDWLFLFRAMAERKPVNAYVVMPHPEVVVISLMHGCGTICALRSETFVQVQKRVEEAPGNLSYHTRERDGMTVRWVVRSGPMKLQYPVSTKIGRAAMFCSRGEDIEVGVIKDISCCVVS